MRHKELILLPFLCCSFIRSLRILREQGIRSGSKVKMVAINPSITKYKETPKKYVPSSITATEKTLRHMIQSGKFDDASHILQRLNSTSLSGGRSIVFMIVEVSLQDMTVLVIALSS